MALKEKILDRAQKYVLKGYLDKAIAEYRAAADVDPRDISIRLRIGDLYVKTGKKADAVKEYTEAAKANSQRGFYLKAIAVYKQVLKLEENLEVHYKLAELYTKQRLIADAISEYSYIVSFFEKKGKTSDVMDLLKKMVEIDSENIGVRLKLADLYQKLAYDRDALEEYSWIYDRLISQGKLDRAEKIYIGLYNSRPTEPEVLKRLVEIYRTKNDPQQFLRFARPLAKIYREADSDAAKPLSEEILNFKPDDQESLNYMARFLSPEMPAKEDLRTPSEKAAEEIKAGPEATTTAADEGGALISWPEEEIEITLEGFEEESGEEKRRKLGEEVEFEVPEQVEQEKPEEPQTIMAEEPAPAEVEEAVSVKEEEALRTDVVIPPSGTDSGDLEIEFDIEEGVPAGVISEEPVSPVSNEEKPAASPTAPPVESIPVQAIEEAKEEEPLIELPEVEIKEAEAPEEIEVEISEAVSVIQENAEEEAEKEEAHAVPQASDDLEIEFSESVSAVEEKVREEAVKEEPVEELPAVTAEAELLESVPPQEAADAAEAPLIEFPEPEKTEHEEIKTEEAEVSVEEKIEAPLIEFPEPHVEVVADAAAETAPAEEKAEPVFELEESTASEAGPEEEMIFEERSPEAAPVQKEEFELISANAPEEAGETSGVHEELKDEDLAEAILEEQEAAPEKEEAVGEIPESPIKEEPEVETPIKEGAAERVLREKIADLDEGGIGELETESEELSEVISELMEKIEPEEEREEPHEEPRFVSPEKIHEETDEADRTEYVDLSAELGMEEALEDKAGSWGGVESRETFDEFKSGIGKSLSKEDSETHYNLGIAYMEMELYSEAEKEFKIALKDPRLEFDCYTRLGLCSIAENRPDEAIIFYLKGLKVETRSEEERKGMMYELALAYEAAGKTDESMQLFKSIYDIDPRYREVSLKIREFAEEMPFMPLDDGLIEVELL